MANDNCAICLESLFDMRISTFKCNHTLHTDCAVEYIGSTDYDIIGHKKIYCPLCRDLLYEKQKIIDINFLLGLPPQNLHNQNSILAKYYYYQRIFQKIFGSLFNLFMNKYFFISYIIFITIIFYIVDYLFPTSDLMKFICDSIYEKPFNVFNMFSRGVLIGAFTHIYFNTAIKNNKLHYYNLIYSDSRILDCVIY